MKFSIYFALVALSQGIDIKRTNKYIPGTLEPCPIGGGTLVNGYTPAVAGTNCNEVSTPHNVGTLAQYIPGTLEHCPIGGGTLVDGTTAAVAGTNCNEVSTPHNVGTLAQKAKTYIPGTLEPCVAEGGTNVDGTTAQVPGTNCKEQTVTKNVNTLAQVHSRYQPNYAGVLEICPIDGGTLVDGTTAAEPGKNCNEGAFDKNVITSLVQLHDTYQPNYAGVLEICPIDGGTLVDGTTAAVPGTNCNEGAFDKNVITSLAQTGSRYQPNYAGVLEICPIDGGTLVDGTTAAEPGKNCQEGAFDKNVITSLVQLNSQLNYIPGTTEPCPDEAFGNTLIDGTTVAVPGTNCHEDTYLKNVETDPLPGALAQLKSKGLPADPTKCKDRGETMIDCQSRVQKI